MTSREGFYHTASSKECLNSISARYGFFWQTIWEHAANAELRRLRKDPNVLFAGDRIFIPEFTSKHVEAATSSRHRFVRKGIPALVHLRFREDGEPAAGVPYVLRIDGVLTRGTTDSRGELSAPIPPGARLGEVILGEGESSRRFEIDLGGMDPASEATGAIKRLEALGYDCGSRGIGLPDTLRAYQQAKGLEPTGTLDTSTQRALVDDFGC